MKKYEIKKAFSLLEKVLLIEGDQVYAEQKLSMIQVYSPKTRKLLGKASIVDFDNYTQEQKITMADCWISVNTRKPDNQNSVMVCTSNGNIGKASFGCYNMKSKTPKWFDLSEEVYGQEKEITSWQLLIGDKS